MCSGYIRRGTALFCPNGLPPGSKESRLYSLERRHPLLREELLDIKNGVDDTVQDILLLYIHRNFFARAVRDPHVDPL